MPFSDSYFDLIISNNGLNNVKNLSKSINEVGRVAKSGCQLVFTFNGNRTMMTVYDAFTKILLSNGMEQEYEKMQCHIREMRPSLEDIKHHLVSAGFEIISVTENTFKMMFTDGTSLFNHFFIRFYFRRAWKSLLAQEEQHDILKKVENLLNEQAKAIGYMSLTIPYFCVDSRME